jgi:hypothetical protein
VRQEQTCKYHVPVLMPVSLGTPNIKHSPYIPDHSQVNKSCPFAAYLNNVSSRPASSSRGMSVVRLQQGGGLPVTIYPIAGLAYVPTLGFSLFWYAKVGGVYYHKSSQVLPALPWERCVEVDTADITDIRITLEDEANMPILIHFFGLSDCCLRRLGQVTRLQTWWRRVLFRKRVARRVHVAHLKVVAMGTHPRLGANSPITVDLLCMIAKIWRV